jgi:hypothetical protein|tara:strand:- start:264 stop:506 length:243 start_codon:yes stop_codon:yes gene_type:complete
MESETAVAQGSKSTQNTKSGRKQIAKLSLRDHLQIFENAVDVVKTEKIKEYNEIIAKSASHQTFNNNSKSKRTLTEEQTQ